ncbi:acetyltransferase, GNAT family protein [Trichomonas vaginalis G3]|uniref:Acetyltransferase, GNAT family protein n=1 Tax=Trichomonas vaginalis (strain ATCC PRA-98 / G3) TaxID=412133 RepID=A2DR43_TRIV3|nr:acetyltransferase (GNAT) domain-containing protein [Trichomonas vaginalis G3]EAY17142.1 acetyltransferase, GNAT family protein [Trichomonas vaginalis G3]KAI5508858.1 acetyltransferase (GNAT) domain-containing protein [Trichomonas vaginalis G3]|eukprot:XP_001329365.1 acetyltransferase, GNAT family protein [Trichomonas vaginalis G3]
MLKIREVSQEDFDPIFHVVEEAFRNADHASHKEQYIVTKLRASKEYIPGLELVGEIDGKIIGHILLTKAFVDEKYETLILGPFSILPNFQNKGYGRLLINAAHQKAIELGHKTIVLVGHSWLYPKFGYKRLSTYNIKMPFPCPDENVFGIELVPGGFDGITGILRFSDGFNADEETQ